MDAEYYQWSPGLDAALENAGFVTSDAQLAPLEAALVIARLAELPLVVEASNSLLLAPALMAGLPRPIAVTMRPLSEPIKYLPIARTLITAAPAGVAAQTMSVNERSYILSEVAQDEGKIDWQKELGAQRLAYARKLSSRELVDQLRMWTVPAETGGIDLLFALKLTDSGERFVLVLQDGAVMFADAGKQPSLTIEMPRERLNQFRAGELSWVQLLKQGDVELSGDRGDANRIFDR